MYPAIGPLAGPVTSPAARRHRAGWQRDLSVSFKVVGISLTRKILDGSRNQIES
jgi:hypothetical protein